MTLKEKSKSLKETGESEYDERWNTPLRNLVLTSSDQNYLKDLRTKRRRIKNYFGGWSGIKEIAVTVLREGNVVGVRIAASSRWGKPGVRETESFIAENRIITNEETLLYGLILVLQLKFQGIKTITYYDKRLSYNPLAIDDPLFVALRQEFFALTFVPADKGAILEQMRKKLQNANRNDIVSGYIEEIRTRFAMAMHFGELSG